ncbi:MAG: hypothetical protein WC809_14090 [Sinimarinibacterium sp.]|jgi:hypothetical protein
MNTSVKKRAQIVLAWYIGFCIFGTLLLIGGVGAEFYAEWGPLKRLALVLFGAPLIPLGYIAAQLILEAVALALKAVFTRSP